MYTCIMSQKKFGPPNIKHLPTPLYMHNFPSPGVRSDRSEINTISGQCGRKVNWSKSTGLGELVAISLY